MGFPSEVTNRGRPRDPETDRRILDTALRLLGRDGYARMSMDAVAAEAGVTKPTIYRRYSGKAELATAALARLAASREQSAPEPTGVLQIDLVRQLRHFQAGVERPYGVTLVGTVLAEEHETPELIELYRRLIVGPRRAMVRTVLEQAQERGGLDAKADLDAAVNALVGSYYATYLAEGSVDEGWADRTVSTVLGGLLPAQGPPGPR